MKPLKLKGAPGSPYTRKMLAYLRYRHIPYEFMVDGSPETASLPDAKVRLMPTFYLPNAQGQLSAVVDSTPLIRRFEAEIPGRKTLPDDPATNFLNYLIEDYADEWLTKPMFHYRWYYDDDIKKAGEILPRWRGLNTRDEQLRAASKMISERQISRLYVVGSNDTTASVIEASYKRFLAIFDKLVEQQTFVLGSRPSSADFGIYAQLTQLAKFDPTPMDVCLRDAPRIFAWVDVIDDLSGINPETRSFASPEELKKTLSPLLQEIGLVYAPALLANAAALQSGEKNWEAAIDGRTWTQPTFPYQGKCLQWIKAEYRGLPADSKAQVDEMLSGTGCEALL